MFKQSILASAVALTLTGCGVAMDLSGQPSTAQPEAANPENSQPAATLPESTLPEANQPSKDRPTAGLPENNQPIVNPTTPANDNNEPATVQPLPALPPVETNPENPTEDNKDQATNLPEETVDGSQPAVKPTEPEQGNTQPALPSQPTAPSYQQGGQYNVGDQVAHNGKRYQCEVAGWCSSDAQAYVPGDGFAWTSAWSLLGDAGEAGSQPSTPDNSTPETEAPQTETPSNEQPVDNGNNNNPSTNPIDTGDMDMSGWPKPLQEKNIAYQNTTQKVVASYFVEWGVYGRDYHVADIPAQNLTHILYGFIPICGPNPSLTAGGPAAALQQACADKKDYEVTIHDKYAALEKSYPGDKWDNPIKGNFGQLMRMKASNPHIKVLPSIGGWTLSDPFFDLHNAQNRATFVASVKDFLIQYPLFDGVDIDWEFPGGGGANPNLGQASDAQTYVVLMRDLRAMLDDLTTQTGRDLELSSAIGTSPRFIQAVDYANAAPYMDYIFMMTYDYKGAWSSETGHQTNLYASNLTADDSLSINIAVNEMLKQNVDPAKLVVGVAKYGRGWQNVSGSSAFNSTGGGALNESGYWEPGIMDYKLIESRYLGGDAEGSGVNGWQHLYDDGAEAAYLWNPSEKKLISFDSTRSVKAKSDYAIRNNLGGVFSWEIDADNGSILNAMHEGLGHPKK